MEKGCTSRSPGQYDREYITVFSLTNWGVDSHLLGGIHPGALGAGSRISQFRRRQPSVGCFVGGTKEGGSNYGSHLAGAFLVRAHTGQG